MVRRLWVALGMAGLFVICGGGAGPAGRIGDAKASAFAKAIAARAVAALDDAEHAGSDEAKWNHAEKAAQETMALTVAYGGTQDIDAYVEADYARRLLGQLAGVDPARRH